jgi:hypothetical protein
MSMTRAWWFVGVLCSACGQSFVSGEPSGAGGGAASATSAGTTGGGGQASSGSSSSASSSGSGGATGSGGGSGGDSGAQQLVDSLQDLLVERPCNTKVNDYCLTVPAPDDTRTAAGAPNVIYDVSLRVRGVVEVNSYSNGTAQGLLYLGGDSVGGYDRYLLVIEDPPSHTFLNNGTAGIRHTFLVDEPLDVRIRAGSNVSLQVGDNDAECLQNNDQDGVPISVAGTPLAQPYDGEFVHIEVLTAQPE